MITSCIKQTDSLAGNRKQKQSQSTFYLKNSCITKSLLLPYCHVLAFFRLFVCSCIYIFLSQDRKRS